MDDALIGEKIIETLIMCFTLFNRIENYIRIKYQSKYQQFNVKEEENNNEKEDSSLIDRVCTNSI